LELDHRVHQAVGNTLIALALFPVLDRLQIRE
jgi:hypothetical protein